MDNSLLIWLLRCLILRVYFPFVLAFLWTVRGLQQMCFRVKNVFNHQPIFLSSFPHVCPCFTFTVRCLWSDHFVLQGWKLFSFSPHTACCGQRLTPWRAFRHSETRPWKTNATAVLPGPESPISSSTRGAGDAPGVAQFSQHLLSHNFPIIL